MAVARSGIAAGAPGLTTATALHTADRMFVRLSYIFVALCAFWLAFASGSAAYAHGIDVANWEAAWCDLLRQYETLSDELAAARPEQAGLPGVSRGRGAA